MGASYLIPQLPYPWPEVLFCVGAVGFLATALLALIFREHRFPLRVRRRKWRPSSKCVQRLKEIRPDDASVTLASHDSPSHYLAQNMKDAFKCAGWEVNYDKSSTWGHSPQVEGIKVYGGSKHLISGVIDVFKKSGLTEIKQVIQPDNFEDRWGTIEFKLAIWDE